MEKKEEMVMPTLKGFKAWLLEKYKDDFDDHGIIKELIYDSDEYEFKNADFNDFEYWEEEGFPGDYSNLFVLQIDDDMLTEMVDSYIEIYNYPLRQWMVDNYEWVEDAISEGLVDTNNFDIHKACIAGQYLQIKDNVYTCLSNIEELDY